MANPAIEQILAAQRADGGWGSYPGTPARTEPTALCTLALARAPEEPDVTRAADAGRDWLAGRQLDSGAWPVGDDVPGPSWTTSLAILALSHFAGTVEQAERGAGWLLSIEGRGAPLLARILLRFAPERQSVVLDTELTGWPWVDGTFSWIEPTAYALLALKRLRPRLSSRRTPGRIDQAERMILDRAIRGGGWNYGNTEVFGETLWPYPDTTALALLALHDRSDAPAVSEGLDALGGMLEENDSLLAGGLGLAAFSVHGRPADGLTARVSARAARPLDGESRALAWAAIALVSTPGDWGPLDA